jgi:hypothetical protein
MCRRRDGRDFRNDTVRENLPVARVIDVHRVVIERRHRGHDRRHHRHGVGVMVEPVEEAQQRLIQHGVMADVVGEFVDLLAVRQLTEQQQVGAFRERALFGELLDRIAAIHQLSGIAVDVGNAAFRRSRHSKAGVIGEDTQVLLNRRNIDDRGTNRAVADGQLRFALSRFIDELEFFVAHAVKIFSSQRGSGATRAEVAPSASQRGLHGPCAESRRKSAAGAVTGE